MIVRALPHPVLYFWIFPFFWIKPARPIRLGGGQSSEYLGNSPKTGVGMAIAKSVPDEVSFKPCFGILRCCNNKKGNTTGGGSTLFSSRKESRK
jgi:hypothetical protein